MTAAPSSRYPKGDATRSRVLDAAVRCLVDGGIDAVRIARVARRAGVSTGLVHYHFATREALLEQALEAAFAVAGEARASTKYGRGPVVRRLRRKLEESLPFPGRRTREWELWVELWARAAREPALRAAAAELYSQLHASWASLIRAAIERGEVGDADPDAVAARVLALIDGYGVRALMGDPTTSVEQALERIWAELAGALAIEA